MSTAFHSRGPISTRPKAEWEDAPGERPIDGGFRDRGPISASPKGEWENAPVERLIDGAAGSSLGASSIRGVRLVYTGICAVS